MTPADPVSRRDSLKGIAGATVAGGTVLAGSSVAFGGDDESSNGPGDSNGTGSSSDERTNPASDADAGRVRLVPICAEPEFDLAVFRVGNGTDESVTASWSVIDPPTITFPDCDTVRITGEFADAIVQVIWWDEQELAGTIAEPIGPVAGERTVNVAEFFGIDAAGGPVVESADAFEPDTPLLPGGGDLSRENPNAEACIEAALAALDGEETRTGSAPTEATPDSPGGLEAAIGRIEFPTAGEVTVPAGASRHLFVHAPEGVATVELTDGETVIDAATSDPETRCREVLADTLDVPTVDGRELEAVLEGHDELDEKAIRRMLARVTGDGTVEPGKPTEANDLRALLEEYERDRHSFVERDE